MTGKKRKLFKGLDAQHWCLVLMNSGWPGPAASLMSAALVKERQMPSWAELHLSGSVGPRPSSPPQELSQ